MTSQRHRPWRIALVCGAAAALFGCDELFGPQACTLVQLPNLFEEVRDAASGAPAGRGVTGVAIHDNGTIAELSAYHADQRLHGHWPRELAGRYTIILRRPGFVAEAVRTRVGQDDCHVKTRTVRAEISPDPGAVEEQPVAFIEGPEIASTQFGATAEVIGDTLKISGISHSNCDLLEVVASRVGTAMHVQLEPSGVRPGGCPSPRLFEVRYRLPPGETQLLVTSAFGFPVTLFRGDVRPAGDS